MTALPTPDYLAISPYRELAEEVDDASRVEALGVFMKPFHARLRELAQNPRSDEDVRIGDGDDVLKSLQDTGYGTATIDPQAKARLQALTAPFARSLAACVEQRADGGLKACQLVLEGEAGKEIGDCVDAILTDTNVYAAASAYAGRPLRLQRVGLQVNTVQSTRSRYGAIDEAGIPEHATSYMHIDSGGWPWIKALIYLSDVTSPDDGPFRYVVGSHRFAEDFELAVRKTNRKLPMPRRLFMALPEPFRLDADFGDIIDPTADDAIAALELERPVCDGAADLVLFNYNGIHRGGFVRRGERFMLQCSLGAATDTVTP